MVLKSHLFQKNLSPVIQNQILTELRTFPDLSDCLAALDIAIGFLTSCNDEPSLYIRDYLHRTLSLPEDRGLRASKKVKKDSKEFGQYT